MQTFHFRLAVTGAALCVALGVAGCTTYEPRPLDLDAHREAWSSRIASDEAVQAFAAELVSAGHAEASGFDADDGLDASEAELVALVYNPDLRLARLRAGVASATAEHAGKWDDPELSLDVLRVTESVANPWVIGTGLSITLPISGRLEAEKSRADAAMRAELERVVEAEWDVRHEVRLACLEWSSRVLRQRELEEFLGSLGGLVDSTGRLAEAGEMVRTEAALFSIEQAQREHELRRVRGLVAEGEQRLRSLMGLAPGAPVTLVPSLELPGGGAIHSETPEGHPSLSRLRVEYEVAEQTLRREIRKQYPDLTIGPLYESDEGQSKIGLLAGIPIPILNANAQGIAGAEGERELARAMFETEYERLTGTMAEARTRAASLGLERELLVGEMAPLVDRQLEDARRLLELGEGGGLVLLESLVRAHDTKMRLIDVRRDEAMAHAALVHLVGPPAITQTTGDGPSETGDEGTP